MIGPSYVKGATVTLWNLQCYSAAAQTVGDCGASPGNFLGVAELVNTNTVNVLSVQGAQTLVNASSAVTRGDTVCAGTTAGKVTDSGGTTACTTGFTVGTVVATSGTWNPYDGSVETFTASATLPLIQLGTVGVSAGSGANAVLNNQVNTGTAAMTLNMAASTVANPFQTPNAVIANSLAYSSGTSNPGTCTASFPPTNNSYFYRTDLNQWEFCHATNTWELVGPQANGSMGLGGSYGFGGPVAIGTEAYVGNSPDVAALTIKHTTTDDLGNATGISNTRIWSPANNSGSYSAILLDQLMYIADPGTSMTVPFYTGESINMQLTGTHTTVTNWNSISIPAPTIPSGSTVGTLTALNIANPCSIAVTTCNAILVGGGIVNLSSASSVSLPASTATSLNGLAVTTSTGTLTVLNGTTLTNPIHQYGASFGTPGGAALTTGGVQYFNMPQACTIGGYEITADAGTATVKFWKIATGTAIPTSANSISTAGVSLGSGTHIYSTTVTDFTTTAVSANDIGAVTLTAVSGAGYVQAVMLCQ